MLKEKSKHLERVTQIDEIVTQLKAECDTEWAKCDTIFEELQRQGIPQKDGTVTWDINDVTQGMKSRIQSKLQNKGINNITVEQFIEHYKEKRVE